MKSCDKAGQLHFYICNYVHMYLMHWDWVMKNEKSTITVTWKQLHTVYVRNYSVDFTKFLSEMDRVNFYLIVLERAHFISNSSFIEFQTVEFEHVSSLTFARVFRVLARVIRVFQVFSSSSLAEFEFWGLKLIEFSSFE